MKYNHFCVIQKGYAIFGIGDTEEKAMDDAKHWLGNDDKDLLWDCLPSYPAANIGELTILPCTDELYGFIQDGGDLTEFVVLEDDHHRYYAEHAGLAEAIKK